MSRVVAIDYGAPLADLPLGPGERPIRHLGHEIGEIRRDKLSAHGDMQARLGRLEDDSRRARGTDTEE